MSNGLPEVMEQLGVDIKRQSGDELNGMCPVHHLTKGRPSTGYHWYINVDTGLWQCFTCGARGNLPYLVSLLTKDPRAIRDVHMFMTQAGLDSLTRDPEDEEEVAADWQDYAMFSEVPQVLLDNRGIDAMQAKRYGLRFNKKHKDTPDGSTRPDYRCLITPVLDPQGNLMGWQAKQDKYFVNVPTGLHKSASLFGYSMTKRDTATTALLVESPLDVVRFHSVYKGDDIQCVSSYGASVSMFQLGLLKGTFKRLVMAMDNDDAGRLESSRLYGFTKDGANLLTGFRHQVWWWDYAGVDCKDLGDMTDEQILTGLENITKQPPHDLPRYTPPVSRGRR